MIQRLGEEASGVPLFHDTGSVVLPRESFEELQESMPVLKLSQD